jgi:hypothetical protein
MSETHYKATRLDGTDFFTGRIDYGAALRDGTVIAHPVPGRDDAKGYISTSTSPTDCTGMRWPCRLFIVEPVGAVWTPEPGELPNKRAVHALLVVEERPAHEALGPQGKHVVALIERARSLSADEAERLAAAWAAARSAAGALVVRDLISAVHYDTLTRPWRTTIGRIHPDDADAMTTEPTR